MDWDNLRVFVELARRGSLSDTARRLKVDHTTVARRIDALEQALDMRLFDRLPRGYLLTARGEAVAALAGRVEEDVLALLRGVGGQESELQGSVRISAPPVFASHFLAPRLPPLRERYPELLVELVGESRSASLSRREADIALRLARPKDGAVIARKLGTLAFGLYGATHYLERPRARWSYLGYDDSLNHVPQQRWLLEKAGGRPLALRTNDLASLYAAARAGLGVAALPRFLGDPDPALARVPADASAAAREIWLLVHPDLRRARRVRLAMDFLEELLARERALLAGERPPRRPTARQKERARRPKTTRPDR